MAFNIEPLQLPRPIQYAQPDFRPLSEIGDTIAIARRRQAIADTLAGATDAQGNLDIEKAGTQLAKIGALDEARPILALAQQKAALAQTAAGMAETARHNQAMENLAREETATIPFGGGLYRKKSGEVLLQPSAEGVLDEDTVKAMATQLRQGDTSVLTNLGRGMQGATNIAAVRKELARQNKAAGETGAEQAQRQAEYLGEKSGQRTLGNRTANIELPAAEFQQMAPLALQASEAINRTQYPSLNSVILAWERGAGDENVVRLAVGANTLANIYARAVSPTGVATDELRKKGNDLLQQAYSKGQFGAAVGMMQQEIEAARRAPASVRQHMRTLATEPQPGSTEPIVPKSVPTTSPQLGQVPIPIPAARKLQANPQLRDAFDEKYGPGASDRVLGPRR